MIFIDRIINKALSLDPKAGQQLKKLDRKILKIQINTQNKEKFFFVCFKEEGIEISPLQTEEDQLLYSPHMTIRGPLKAYVVLALRKNPHTAAKMGLSFEGEAESLVVVQSLFFDLNIDWEEMLSEWTGDIPAAQLGKIAKYALKRQKELYQSTQYSIAEYLTEELKVLPTKVETTSFLDNVDILRAGVNRLSVRIDRLSLMMDKENQE